MTESISWNDIPYNPQADAAQKADEFDRQYAENKDNGDAKEQAGTYRPEPGMK